ncbi:MAG: ATPase [Gammaproteobacteria bacterium RIFCSPHIGHO2_12_FULL_41_15]|nr:MAG: ATPase [Gammaproteobacteria bacterium RIFCSPHIGHO2_12_FULL_41_15]
MMYINRILDLKQLIEKKSHFLFGPRATGKSSLIEHQLANDCLLIDLLHSETYLRLIENPSALEAMIAVTEKKWVVLDEVQRVPEILNEVHRLIEKKGITFLLTGSSARKLKKQSVNLLAGRARQAELYPLTYHELPNFNLASYLQYGGLPMVVLSHEPAEDLDAYVYTYLEQEIKAEALVQKLPAFSKFLQLSALTSGNTLNYASIASDAGVSAMTLREYYQILEDTFLGFTLLPWQHSTKRKAVTTGRFYYFDTGVKNRLAQISSIPEQSDLYGQAFEHFIAMELRAYLSYTRKKLPLCFWRTVEGVEVDFIIGDDIAIEIKSTQKISDKHLKTLKRLQEENKLKAYYLISRDSVAMKKGDIFILPWETFLKKLWDGEVI